MESAYRILLVEDSRTQAERMRGLLRREGWEVAHAATAESAFDQINETRPDLIILDYYLPGMNGDEFCREIRMNVNTRSIPVLMLTVEGTDDAERRGLESGADDYLAKSGDPDVLLLRIRALLRKSQGPHPIVGPVEHPFSRARLLAIDDSPTYLEYLAQQLSTEHYVVEKATSGQEGLERIRREPFDCVLVDLEMPEVDGLEVCRRLNEMRRNTNAPTAVVVLTSHEEKEHMTAGLEAGADDFIGKSAEFAVLKSRIRALLRRKFFMEENRRIAEELKERELEAVRARAEQQAAEVRAVMADKLAESNRELEKANRKLQEALDVTRAITQHAAEALFMMDAHGRVTFMNPAAERLLGFAQAELAGQVLHDKIHVRRPDGSDFPFEECPLGQSLARGITLIGHEDVFFRKDGSPVDVACSSAPIVQDGTVSAGVLVVHDISERKRSEERLRQAQKLESVGLLAGGIAHDFNNILTTVLGTASLIEADAPPSMAEEIRTIIAGAERAADLTRQLLAYAGKGQFIIHQLDLSSIVREMAGLIRLSIPKEIKIDFQLNDALPLVAADPGQIQQVVMNLVSNAGEAFETPTRGEVSISTGIEEPAAGFIDAAGAEIAPGRYVYLEVADTGCGMNEQTQARILEPFYTTKFTGRGLGLAAVSGILRAQRGGIKIDSAPGVGSTFRVLFPAVKGSGGAHPNGQPAILVAEDEEGIRDLLRSVLERQGYAVLLAREGREALALWEANRERIRLVVIDLAMQATGGRQLLAEIKSRLPEASVLLTSGGDEGEARRLCATYPGTGFLQKPYTSGTLIREIETVVQSRG